MGLSSELMRECLNAATAAAYRAGARVMSHYGRSVDVGSKGREHLAGDVVTVADHEAQEAILDVVAGLSPDIGILAEEEGQDAGRSRFEKECFWCIDPLDGTLPFLERSNGFAVSIALVSRSGEPLMGVVYAPAFGDLYHAVAGGKAYKNGEPLSVGRAQGTLHLSTSANDAIPPARNEALNHVMKGLSGLKRIQKTGPVLHGGAVIKACWVCENPPACYLSLPRPDGGVSVWYCAATACIVKAAGGWVSDLFGRPLELNRRESTFMHHRGLLYASDDELARTVIEGYAGWERSERSTR